MGTSVFGSIEIIGTNESMGLVMPELSELGIQECREGPVYLGVGWCAAHHSPQMSLKPAPFRCAQVEVIMKWATVGFHIAVSKKELDYQLTASDIRVVPCEIESVDQWCFAHKAYWEIEIPPKPRPPCLYVVAILKWAQGGYDALLNRPK